MTNWVEFATLSLPRTGSEASGNEDCVQVGPPEQGDWASFAGIVADGVGSSVNAAAASRATASAFLSFLGDKLTQEAQQLPAYESVHFRQILEHSLLQTHQQVVRAAVGGKSTAAAVCIEGDWLLIANVGDSRVYRLRDGALQRLSTDQVDAGGNPTDVMGGRPAPPGVVTRAERDVRAGDVLLLCTDGLLKLLPEEDLAAWLNECADPAAAVAALQPVLNAGRLPDDLSFILARVARAGTTGRPGLANEPGPEPALAQEVLPLPAYRNPEPPSSIERRLAALESDVTAVRRTQDTRPLEAALSKLSDRVSELEGASERGGPRRNAPLLAIATACLLAGGLMGVFAARHWNAPSPAAAPARKAPLVARVVRPPDIQATLELRTADRFFLWKYRATDGSIRQAVYLYTGDGTPARVLVLPRDTTRLQHPSIQAPGGRAAGGGRSSRPTRAAG